MHVRQPAIYTPPSMRRRGRNHGASKDLQKQLAFKRAAAWSKQFIHQSASALASPRLAHQYQEWSEAANRGVLRRASGK